jgi:nucleoside-diphosphate-sugar epimerase
LAEAGFIPFVYSIVTFAVLRPYEFIRNGPIQHRLRVRIVGVGGGVEYGTNGLSHYGFEDVAVLRAQLGWQPRHDFESGLRRTVEWQRAFARADGLRPS